MLRVYPRNPANFIKSVRSLLENVTFRRNLYAPATLGINGYLEMRERTNGQFANTVDKFKEKMNVFAEDKTTQMIFTEDLRNIIHLAENNKADIDLVVKMIKKFHSQSKEIRFGNYVFGPIVFRMFHHLGDIDTALECFKDQALEGFFDQVITYQLLMDMLYERGRYQDILDVFNIIKSRQAVGTKYARHIVVLTMAACYKMNTPESLQFALDLMKEINAERLVPMRKATAFAAGLALKQNSPHIALEMVSNAKDQHYVTIRNIKVQAFAEMNRPEDALTILRAALEVDDPVAKGKRTFVRDIVNKVSEAIQKNNRKDLETDFKRIEKFLVDQGNITDDSLDHFLCAPVTETTFTSQRREKSSVSSSFSRDYQQRDRNNRPRIQNYRQGLADIS